jgi:hypothetical protein
MLHDLCFLLEVLRDYHSLTLALAMSASAVQTSIKTALGALPSKFSKARSSGALYFFDSEVKDVEQDGNRVSQRRI